MPVLRFSRDKRGYEYFYLVEAVTRRGRTKSQVLYWFRTPPGVKVGREPFDAEIRHSLERQYPDLSFDWAALSETPAPRPENERWRERRDAQRAARLAARAGDDEADEDTPETSAAPSPAVAAQTGDGSAEAQDAGRPATGRSRRRRGRRGRRPAGGDNPDTPLEVRAEGSRASTSDAEPEDRPQSEDIA